MPTATKTTNAITLLKNDHKQLKDLFDSFEKAKSDQQKEKFAQEALQLLRVHAAIEEELFYPKARQEIGQEEETEELLNEAEEEHRVAKTLVEDLSKSSMSSDEHFEAKFMVLAENVRHHIKEEEGEMFPEIKDSDLDLEEIGQELETRRQELLANEQELKKAEESAEVQPFQKLGA
jgi:hemerythrin superfamily protein